MLADMPGSRMDNAQAQPDWVACRDLKLPFFTAPPLTGQALGLWRISVPQTAPVLNLPWAQLVEWHGGQRWLWAPDSAREQLRKAALEAGGSATLFIASNSEDTCAKGRFNPLNPALAQIHRRLKTEFDPAGIFNPGRMYPEF
jgi:glycolate oxidase FAD binding subunit